MKRIFAFILCLLAVKANATHIVGGEIMYKYVSKSNGFITYDISMYLYIDCINGSKVAIESDVDGYINAFSYNASSGNYSLYKSQQLTFARTGPITVSDVNYSCIKNKPNACVDKYTYKITMSLPANNDGYVLAFERCCRNNSIKNIMYPEATGATYWTKIPGVNKIAIDNSPIFKSLPPNFLCTNAPLNFDHSATDADGDSLVYELYVPYIGATSNASLPSPSQATNPASFSQVQWVQNGSVTYSLYNQIDGAPTLSINRRTGKLTLTPSADGQYVVGIKVLEFRKGKLIGETKRDFQFNVSQCVFEVVSSFGIPYYNCQGDLLSFQNRSQGANNYHWDFGVDTTKNDTSVLKNANYTYNSPGTYNIRLIAKGTICTDTSEFEVMVKPKFKTKLANDTLICGPFTKTLTTNTPGKSYLWSTGEKTPSIVVKTGGKYTVSVTDAPCTARDTITIINDLSRLDIGPDSVICRDSFVQFTYPGKAGYKTYLWNDNTTKDSVFISKLGTYWVNVVNKNNCPSSDTITFVLYPPPHVNLNDTLFCKGTSVVLDGVNYSVKTKLETNYLWNNGENTPQIVTGIPGLYIVKVRNRLCTIYDTATITHIETGLELGNDTFYCGPVVRWLRPMKGYVKYVWHDFAETIDYYATSPGKKKLTITTKEGCVESDSVNLIQYPNADAGLGNDTTICLSSRFELKASDSMVNYLWNTGATSQSIFIKDSGVYFVTVKNINGCVVADTIRIKEDGNAVPSEMYMPNAFTPNDDGLNEFYPGNQYKDPGASYLLRIYNRWGEKVFESDLPAIQWNGMYKDNMVPQDVYVFYVKYLACDEKEHWVRGTFTLLR